MSYVSYKGRTINVNEPVEVYKNLHKDMWSVRQGGKVVAHCKDIALSDVRFKVSEAGRARVLHERKKNVHAFVIGYVEHTQPVDHLILISGKRVSYNPYVAGHFRWCDGSERKAKVYYDEVLHCSVEHGLYIHTKQG